MKTKQGRQTFLAMVAVAVLVSALIFTTELTLLQAMATIIGCLVFSALVILALVWADKGE